MIPYIIREVKKTDLREVIQLFRQYTMELYNIKTTLTEDKIQRDGFGNKFDMAIAEYITNKKIVGLVAWQDSYDLHWGVTGGIIIDLYVDPNHRGKAIAPLLLSFNAKRIKEKGGNYLSGLGIVNKTHPEKMYNKIAIGVPGIECILGGKAFRVFSELDSSDIRKFLKGLPKREWNYE
jgi:GNAT superfamily N-acetyltransferase